MGMYLGIHVLDAEDVKRIRTTEAFRSWLMDDVEPDVELDKAWDLLGRWMRDGSPEGLFAYGEAFVDVDCGYGPPVAVSGDGLARLCQDLAAHDEDSLRRYLESFRAGDEAPYPFHRGIDPDENDETCRWLLPLAEELLEVATETRDAAGTLLLVLS